MADEFHTGQFKYPAVQRYIHDLTAEMGSHIDSITSTLLLFIEVGVPTIKYAQKHGATNLLNLSTVATFFSAVSATTLQISYGMNEGPLQSKSMSEEMVQALNHDLQTLSMSFGSHLLYSRLQLPSTVFWVSVSHTVYRADNWGLTLFSRSMETGDVVCIPPVDHFSDSDIFSVVHQGLECLG